MNRMLVFIMTLALGLLLTTGLAPAQGMMQPGTTNPPAAAPGSTHRHNRMGGETRMDRTFYNRAAESGQFEVEISKLAEDKAASQEVKDLARMMVDDHTKANQELMSIAQKNQVQLATALPARETKRLEHFRSMTGADFDRAYVEELIKDHRSTISLFEHEADKGSDADVKTFASNTLPTLRQHLQHAEQVLSTLPKRGGATR